MARAKTRAQDKGTQGKAQGDRILAVNRRAYYDYSVLDSIEAGLVLTGTEIKSLRSGRVNIREAFARREAGELWLYGMHIAPYPQGNIYNHEPTRRRKLLLHKGQILALGGQVEAKGLTLVPLRLYITRRRAKVELGLVRGRRTYDKREAIARRDVEREMQRAVRRRV